jgi:anaphase-promoting complex subunit 4
VQDHFSFHTHVAVVPQGQLNQSEKWLDPTIFQTSLIYPPVRVIQIALVVENGISTVQSVDSSAVQLGNGQAKDIKFVDGNTLLVLWESNG